MQRSKEETYDQWFLSVHLKTLHPYWDRVRLKCNAGLQAWLHKPRYFWLCWCTVPSLASIWYQHPHVTNTCSIWTVGISVTDVSRFDVWHIFWCSSHCFEVKRGWKLKLRAGVLVSVTHTNYPKKKQMLLSIPFQRQHDTNTWSMWTVGISTTLNVTFQKWTHTIPSSVLRMRSYFCPSAISYVGLQIAGKGVFLPPVFWAIS